MIIRGADCKVAIKVSASSIASSKIGYVGKPPKARVNRPPATDTCQASNITSVTALIAPKSHARPKTRPPRAVSGRDDRAGFARGQLFECALEVREREESPGNDRIPTLIDILPKQTDTLVDIPLENFMRKQKAEPIDMLQGHA
jgi:hypothetical protein